MTAVWGPLGWMTLHSVSHNYPDAPNSQEKQLASQWIDLFRDCITCPSCQGHFTELLANYRSTYPYYLDSRTEFILFTYRAHNTVNRRLDKPVYNSVEECEAVFSRNLAARSAPEYRSAYILHIRRHWSSLQDMNGIAHLRKVLEMGNIERQYWSLRENPTSTLTGLAVSPLPDRSPPSTNSGIFFRPVAASGISFTGGRLRFQRR
jgi:hypothetical protein